MRLLDLDKYKKKRPRKLLGLDVQEVSLVDNPANLIPLMIVKGYNPAFPEDILEKVIRHEGDKWVLYTKDGKKKLGTFDSKAEALAQERAIHARQTQKSDDVLLSVEKVKADKLECNIVTDFSVDGTKVKINGKKIDGINGVNLYIWDSTMENGMPGPKKVYFSYSTRKQVGDSEEYVTYSYSPKAQMDVEKETKEMDMELTKVLKSLFEEVPDGFDDLDEESQKELAKNLSLVEEYVSDMPPALREAIGKCLLVKAAQPDLKSIADILTEAAEGIRSAMGAENDEGDKKGDKDKDDKKTDDKDVNLNLLVSVKPEPSPKKEDEVKPEVTPVKPDDKKPEAEVDLNEAEIEALAEEAVSGAMDEVLGGKT